MKKKHIIYICLSVLTLLWLVFSTPIIEKVINKGKTINSTKPLDSNTLSIAYTVFDAIELSDSMFDIIKVYGGLVYPFSSEENIYTRSLILSGKENSYTIPLTAVSHWSRNLHPKASDGKKRITGFLDEISVLGLKNGNYNVIFQEEENGAPVARVNSGYVLEKVKGHAKMVYKPSAIYEGSIVPKENAWANSGINEATVSQDGSLNITGWGIIENEETSDTNIYIQLMSKGELVGTYTTTKECITYIADHFDNDNYLSAGFKASIPNVPAESMEIHIYIEKNGEFYPCSYYFMPTDESFSEFAAVSPKQDTPEQKQEFVPSVKYEGTPEILDWANAGLDTVQLLEDGTLNLTGWGVIDKVASDNTQVYVEVKSEGKSSGFYDSEKQEAAHIAEYFNDDMYLKSGFSASIPNVSAKDLQIYIYVQHEGKFYRCSYHFKPTDEALTKFEAVSDVE